MSQNNDDSGINCSVIFLDANFLLVPSQFSIDIYTEFKRLLPPPCEFVIVTAIFDELDKKIANSPAKTKLARQYRMARQLLDRHPYRVIKKARNSGQLVDDLLLEQACNARGKNNMVYLATNDKQLKYKCIRKGIRVVYIRQKKFLDIE